MLKQTRSPWPFGGKCGICAGQCDVTRYSPISQLECTDVNVVEKLMASAARIEGRTGVKDNSNVLNISEFYLFYLLMPRPIFARPFWEDFGRISMKRAKNCPARNSCQIFDAMDAFWVILTLFGKVC